MVGARGQRGAEWSARQWPPPSMAISRHALCQPSWAPPAVLRFLRQGTFAESSPRSPGVILECLVDTSSSEQHTALTTPERGTACVHQLIPKVLHHHPRAPSKAAQVNLAPPSSPHTSGPQSASAPTAVGPGDCANLDPRWNCPALGLDVEAWRCRAQMELPEQSTRTLHPAETQPRGYGGVGARRGVSLDYRQIRVLEPKRISSWTPHVISVRRETRLNPT